jgi:molybdopterin converting factor small subunit
MARVVVKIWASISHLFTEEQITPRYLDVEIEDGAALETLLRKLGQDYPRFDKVMFDPSSVESIGEVTVLVNDRLLDEADGFQTRLRDGDRVSLVQTYAGG